MVRFRWFYNTDKETEWLNRMAGQGWAMTGFCLGFYRFTRCEPGEYIYQTDVTEKMFGVSEDYRQFMEETGAEIVCLWGFWVFLRRRAQEGPFRMYTDVESTIGYYTKMKNFFGTAEAIEAGGMLSGISAAVMTYSPFVRVLALVAGLFLLLFLQQSVRLKKILKELEGRREKTVAMSDESTRPHMLWKRVAIVASLFGTPVLYTVLHELGHCIAVWICGGTVTGFYPFGTHDYVTPHMTYEGIADSFSQGLVHIFGSVVPLAAVVAVLLFWKGSKKHSLLNICVGILSGIFLMPTITWIVEPMGRLMNRFDYRSDVFKFIDTTGLHPIVVMLCALLIFGLTLLLFVKRRARLSLGFMDRRFAVRFLAFLVTLSFTFMLFVYFGSVGTDTILAEGNVAYGITGGRNSILQSEYEISVTEPGEYVCYAEWKLDREGVVAGMSLKSEDETYLSCTANWVQAEFSPVYLDSGSYSLCFYILTCEEDWLEYCEITGAEPSDLADYVWEPGAPAAVTGRYRIIRNLSQENLISGGKQDG